MHERIGYTKVNSEQAKALKQPVKIFEYVGNAQGLQQKITEMRHIIKRKKTIRK